MKQFTKISLVTILSFIGVILTVMFRDVVFQAVGPAIGLFENGQPTPVAGTTVLFLGYVSCDATVVSRKTQMASTFSLSNPQRCELENGVTCNRCHNLGNVTTTLGYN